MLSLKIAPKNAPSVCADEPMAHFGGPDVAPGLLRDLLELRIAETPDSGAIRWAVYYFNDPSLALALMRASDRGVDVRLVIEGAPHHVAANRRVIETLRRHGLNGGLHVLHDGLPFAHPLHMHAKVYAFRHFGGSAFIGSYNPLNGHLPGARQSLGDHDQGDNLLVEVVDTGAINALCGYVDRLASSGWTTLRNGVEQNRVVRTGQIDFHFFPRREVDAIEHEIGWLCAGDFVRGCVSHLDHGPIAAALTAAAARGVQVSLYLGRPGRRVCRGALRRLQAAGADIRLHDGRADLPMHAKFLVLRNAAEAAVFFGSFNLNLASRWLNHEVLGRSCAPSLVAAFEQRFLTLHNRAAPAFEETCP